MYTFQPPSLDYATAWRRWPRAYIHGERSLYNAYYSDRVVSMTSHDNGHCERAAESRSYEHTSSDADKTCAVCMDVVLHKQPVCKRMFAILPNCNHCFCVDCIRTWRKQSRDFATGVTTGCPVCRTVSPYYVPSNSWIEEPAEKAALCSSHKLVMAGIPCKYFSRGSCCFGSKCFYNHTPSEESVPRPRPAPMVGGFALIPLEITINNGAATTRFMVIM